MQCTKTNFLFQQHSSTIFLSIDPLIQLNFHHSFIFKSKIFIFRSQLTENSYPIRLFQERAHFSFSSTHTIHNASYLLLRNSNNLNLFPLFQLIKSIQFVKLSLTITNFFPNCIKFAINAKFQRNTNFCLCTNWTDCIAANVNETLLTQRTLVS